MPGDDELALAGCRTASAEVWEEERAQAWVYGVRCARFVTGIMVLFSAETGSRSMARCSHNLSVKIVKPNRMRGLNWIAFAA